MSGGSYDYAYGKIEDLAREIRLEGSCHTAPPHLRRAFKAHLMKVAAAARAIEWNDSSDGDAAETQRILDCIGQDGDLRAATDEALKAAAELEAAIQRAEKQPR